MRNTFLVVYFNLLSIGGNNEREMSNSYADAVWNAFSKHSYLSRSKRLEPYQRELVNRILSWTRASIEGQTT